jgi:thiol-disulfide isomerase/thioredoxin
MKQIKSETAFKTALLSRKPVVVFWSGRAWCPHCVAMEPIVDLAEKDHPSMEFLNVDDSAEEAFTALAQQYLTERDGLPTFMVFRLGKRVAKKGGSCSEKIFTRWLVDAAGR